MHHALREKEDNLWKREEQVQQKPKGWSCELNISRDCGW